MTDIPPRDRPWAFVPRNAGDSLWLMHQFLGGMTAHAMRGDWAWARHSLRQAVRAAEMALTYLEANAEAGRKEEQRQATAEELIY